MADLTSVGVTSGVPSSGTGTVATINQLIIVGSPISNGSTSAPVIAGLVGPSSNVTSSMTGLVAAIGYMSSAVTLQSVASLSSGTVFVSSGSLATVGTIGSISSGTIALSSNSPGIIATGTAGAGSSVFLSVQGASNGTPIPVFPTAAANGGASNLLVFTSSAAVSAATVKASSNAGTVYGIQGINISSIPVVLKLYDAISTAVSVGTTVPKYALPIPCVVTTGSGAVSPFPVGIAFTNAITYAITANAWSSDATAVVAGGTINIQYA